MGLSTSSKGGGGNCSSPKGPGSMPPPGIIFEEGDPARSPVKVSVKKSQPVIKVVAVGLPKDYRIEVWEHFSDSSEYDKCHPIPPKRVLCADGCSGLELFNLPNPDCEDGYQLQDTIYLYSSGVYSFLMYGPDGSVITEVPEGVHVYYKPDGAMEANNSNVPACGLNVCPPDCVASHAIKVEGPPTHIPDCLLCEAPVAYTKNEDGIIECIYIFGAPPNTTCADGEVEGVWDSFCIPDICYLLQRYVEEFFTCENGCEFPTKDINSITFFGLDENGECGLYDIACPPVDETPLEGGDYVWTCSEGDEGDGGEVTPPVVQRPLPTACETMQAFFESAGDPEIVALQDLAIPTINEDGECFIANIGCPEVVNEEIDPEEGETGYVWTCDSSGAPVRRPLPPGCCPEIEIAKGVGAVGSCFDVPAGNAIYSVKANGSHVGDALFVSIKYTNTTDAPVMVDARFNMYLYRYDPSTNAKANVLFLAGDRALIDNGPESSFVGNTNTVNSAVGQRSTAYDIRVLPDWDAQQNIFTYPHTLTHPVYAPQGFSGRSHVSSMLVVEKMVLPGQSVELIGYAIIYYTNAGKEVDSLYFMGEGGAIIHKYLGNVTEI